MSPRRKEKNQAQKPSVLGNLMTICVILFSNLKSLKSRTYLRLYPGHPGQGSKSGIGPANLEWVAALNEWVAPSCLSSKGLIKLTVHMDTTTWQRPGYNALSQSNTN